MMRSLWVAKTGLDAQQTHMDVIANNLANVSTGGFKRSRAVFEDLMYQTLRMPGAPSSQQTQLPTGLQVGGGVRIVATDRIHTQGNILMTSNEKDVAIMGAGYFQILMPDGTTAYTRDGTFEVDNQGQFVTASGYFLQPAIIVPMDSRSLTITRDGIVSVIPVGQNLPVQIGAIQLATFINPAGLESLGENLFAETDTSGTPAVNTPGDNNTGTLRQRYIEGSNVNVAEELVNMIQTHRAYEMNSKAITTSDQMLQRLTQM